MANPYVTCEGPDSRDTIALTLDELPQAPAYAIFYHNETHCAEVMALVHPDYFERDRIPSGGVSIVFDRAKLVRLVHENIAREEPSHA